MNYSKIIVVTLLFLAFCILSSEAQVTVNLSQSRSDKFQIENMWIGSLNNITKNNYNVYLVGSVSRKDGKIVEATTAEFPLPPGLKIINKKELSPILVNKSESKYLEIVKQMGTVSTSDYDITVTVYNSKDNSVLGKCVFKK